VWGYIAYKFAQSYCCCDLAISGAEYSANRSQSREQANVRKIVEGGRKGREDIAGDDRLSHFRGQLALWVRGEQINSFDRVQNMGNLTCLSNFSY